MTLNISIVKLTEDQKQCSPLTGSPMSVDAATAASPAAVGDSLFKKKTVMVVEVKNWKRLLNFVKTSNTIDEKCN